MCFTQVSFRKRSHIYKGINSSECQFRISCMFVLLDISYHDYILDCSNGYFWAYTPYTYRHIYALIYMHIYKVICI